MDYFHLDIKTHLRKAKIEVEFICVWYDTPWHAQLHPKLRRDILRYQMNLNMLKTA